MPKEYKYHCRPCPPHIRRQCIQEARISPGIKRIIERAFESHTDTQETWDALQRNCLLVRRDKLLAGRSESTEGGLLARMRKQKQETAPTETEESPPVITPSSSPKTSSEAKPAAASPSKQASTDRLSAPPSYPSQQRRERRTTPFTEAEPRRIRPRESPVKEPPPRESRIRYPFVSRPLPSNRLMQGPKMLVARASGHRIALPENNELVLGRFDPLSRVTPDVDLTFEDQWSRDISRRHTRITGKRGQYQIADLGSNHGTWVNGRRLALEDRQSLQVGDEVRLGSCVLFFDLAPEVWKKPAPAGQYFLYVTFSGHYLPLPPQGTIIIGRADPLLEFKPDIDLSVEGYVGSVVSRRHAKLIRKGTQFLVEDHGSANRTRIDGQLVPIDTQTPIRPGQHLWLGGCVLALDIA